MTERPILFSAPMVRALLAGTKTQTRRVVKPVGDDDGFVLQDYGDGWWPYRSDDGESSMKNGMEIPHSCPYGQPGDRLWVRETWAPEQYDVDAATIAQIEASVRMPAYAADFSGQPAYRWRPSIHMPRWASRITLEVTAVRVERLQDISEADALAEGTPCYVCGGPLDGRSESDCHCFHHKAKPSDYRALWEQINGPGSWDANPWVWVVEFRRLP